MELISLCPACLDELPEDYPLDHVLLDRALGDEPELYARMSRGEKRAVLELAEARGMTITALSRHFRRSQGELERVLQPSVPQPRRRGGPYDQRVTDMTRRGMSAHRIADELGMWRRNVQRIQKRLGLKDAAADETREVCHA